MSVKINDMLKYHPHQGFWRKMELGDFASRDAGKANPSGLTHAVAIRYKDSGPSEPKPVILRGICWLQRESARFLVNLNAESRARSIKDSVVEILLCSLPSLDKQTGKSHRRKVRSSAQGGTGCATQSRGRMASATTEDQQAASGSQGVTLVLQFQAHHVIERSTLKK